MEREAEVTSARSSTQAREPAFPVLAICLLLCLGASASPVGRAGDGYQPAVPPYHFSFPRDHAAHPEYQTEWWYYTGHLDHQNHRFGYELTFFQVGINPRHRASKSAWALHTLYFAHFTLTDENRRTFRFTDSVCRPALGMAGSETSRYHVWIHDWLARLREDGKTHHLHAATPGFAIDLDLEAKKPPVIHGFQGVSQKAPGRGHASHYYSLTRLETRGRLQVDGKRLPVTGLSWMDHEFGSNQMTLEQAGWDWYSLQLDDQREIMLYVMRRKDGSVEPVSSGTLVEPDGSGRHLPLSACRVRASGFWKSPRSGARYPAGWTIRIPAEGLDLKIAPAVADQELRTGGAVPVTYWEGSVRVEGRSRAKPVKGYGYVELTGYAGRAPGV